MEFAFCFLNIFAWQCQRLLCALRHRAGIRFVLHHSRGRMLNAELIACRLIGRTVIAQIFLLLGATASTTTCRRWLVHKYRAPRQRTAARRWLLRRVTWKGFPRLTSLSACLSLRTRTFRAAGNATINTDKPTVAGFIKRYQGEADDLYSRSLPDNIITRSTVVKFYRKMVSEQKLLFASRSALP